MVLWHRCTAILVVFPREEFLLAGYLAARITGAKLFPYFHNTFVENRSGWSLRFARWLQRRVFASAAHVFVMSEGMRELYRERYPDLACSVLVHSFNEEVPAFASPPVPGSRPRFAICGDINESCRDATVRVCAAIARVDGATLTFVSGTPRAALERLGLLREGVAHVTVPRHDVVRRLQHADIVVLAHGFQGGLSVEEYRTIFPTRTIEYLLCGRPMLAHAPATSFLARFLREHDCALLVTDPSETALLDALARLQHDAALRALLVKNALTAAELFRAARVVQPLRARLGLGRVATVAVAQPAVPA
jgi:hypothetical protein